MGAEMCIRDSTPADRSIQGRGIMPDIVVERREFAEAEQESEAMVRESDLDGALEHESEKEFPSDSSGSANPAVGNDYQLQEALNLLKGLRISREITG